MRRWLICALLFAATLINYVAGQILSLLKPILDIELGWTNEEFGWVNSLFQGAYAVSYLAFGWCVDRRGTRIGYAVSIAAWSLAAAAHALVNSVGGFAIARIALGLGEGGNFPAAIEAVARRFTARSAPWRPPCSIRGRMSAPCWPRRLIPPLAMAIGWHGIFLLAGAAGFVWLV